jgi:hypothetical protein
MKVILEILRDLEEIHFVNDRNIHVDPTWLVRDSIGCLLRLGAILQNKHVLNLSRMLVVICWPVLTISEIAATPFRSIADALYPILLSSIRSPLRY